AVDERPKPDHAGQQSGEREQVAGHHQQRHCRAACALLELVLHFAEFRLVLLGLFLLLFGFDFDRVALFDRLVILLVVIVRLLSGGCGAFGRGLCEFQHFGFLFLLLLLLLLLFFLGTHFWHERLAAFGALHRLPNLHAGGRLQRHPAFGIRASIR